MTSNIRDTDKLLLQRDGSSYYIETQDLTEFQTDSVQGVIEGLNDKLEQEILDRIDGDDALELKVDLYRDYVRSGVDLLFPSIDEGDYSFNLSIVEQSTYINRYNQCVNSIDPSLTEEEKEEAKQDCYYSATAAVYNDIGTLGLDLTGSFKILAVASTNYKETHTLIIDETTFDGSTIDWDAVSKDDFLSIGRHNENGKSSDTDYGFYKVKKNLSRHLIDNNLVTEIPGLHMLELEYQSGNDQQPYFPTGKYVVRAMSDIKGDLSGDFVSKTGDTMSGTLKFDNSKIEIFGGSTSGAAIHFTEPGNQTIYKDSDALIIKVGAFGGGTGVAFNEDGTVDGVGLPDGTDVTSVVNVGYVDTKIDEVVLDITQLENSINIVDQRIDAAIKVLDIFRYNLVNINAGDGIDLNAWTAQEIANVTNGDIKFYDKELANVIIIPNTEINQRVIMSQVDSTNRPIFFDSGAINVGDYLEFSCEDGEPSDFTYQIVDFVIDQSGYYQFDLDLKVKFGEGELQADKTYKVKQISSQQALTLDDANTRFVAKTGDTVTGQLTIKSADPSDVVLETSNSDNSNSLKVTKDGTFNIVTNDLSAHCDLKFNDGNISRNLRLVADGLYSDASVNPSFNIYVSDTQVPRFTVSAASIDARNNPIKNVGLASSDNPKDVVTVEYFNTHIIDRIGPGFGVSIDENPDGIAIISVNSTFSVSAASDVVTTTFEDGDIIIYNATTGKFENKTLGNSIRGKSMMASSEDQAEIGGMWTDGTNYYIRTS
jgi:hypothetical protein